MLQCHMDSQGLWSWQKAVVQIKYLWISKKNVHKQQMLLNVI